MKCVPMYPLVLAPQIKKVKNNSQKSPNVDAFFNAANAMTMGLALLWPHRPLRRQPHRGDAIRSLKAFQAEATPRLAARSRRQEPPAARGSATPDVPRPRPSGAERPVVPSQSSP